MDNGNFDGGWWMLKLKFVFQHIRHKYFFNLTYQEARDEDPGSRIQNRVLSLLLDIFIRSN